MRISLEDIFNIPSAVIYYPERYKSVSSVSIDTRTIKRNSLYVALKGKNFDGHLFVKDAIKKGAKAVVVSNRKLNMFDDLQIPIISVKNTLDAYSSLAKVWRNKLNAKVISITGSNGKTSTKEILAHLLSSRFKVHKTVANNNNQIGVPLTILNTPSNTDFIILEHGTNHFGEIEYTAKIANPDLALITNIGNSHTQFLKSKEKILEEKLDLFQNINEDGIVFINHDDPYLKKIKKAYVNSITYGFKGKCDVLGKRLNSENRNSERIRVVGFGKKIETNIPLLGESNSQNILAATAVAIKCRVPKTQIIKQIRTLKNIKGRLQEIVYKNFTIINDTYNSNPDSAKEAIKSLINYKGRSYKYLVFGDMFELGENTNLFHREIAKKIDNKNIHGIFTLGKNSKYLSDSLTKVKSKKHFTTREALKKHLKNLSINDSVILFKGSRGMRMEEFVQVISERKK